MRKDQFGNVFLDKKNAIFPSKKLVDGEVSLKGNYIVLRNGEFIFDGPDFKRFDSLDMAMKELESVNHNVGK